MGETTGPRSSTPTDAGGAATFPIEVEATKLVCPTGERYGAQVIADGRIPVLGCFLRCQARQMRRMLRPDQLVEVEVLPFYNKWTDRFDIDDVPEAERNAVADAVARRLLAELAPTVAVATRTAPRLA